MDHISFSGPAGSLMLELEEADGSTSTIDLTPYADTLLSAGLAHPRSASTLAHATSTLGSLEWNDQAVFTSVARPSAPLDPVGSAGSTPSKESATSTLDPETAITVLTDGLIWVLTSAAERVLAADADSAQ